MPMLFLKKSSKYEVLYNKKQAAIELLKDSRVQSVTRTHKGLIVNTAPIIPVNLTRIMKRLLFYPTGQFEITLIKSKSDYSKYIWVYIQSLRQKRFYNLQLNPHIANFDKKYIEGGTQICLGTICGEYWTAAQKMDWYWVTKFILNLLEDYSDTAINPLTLLCLFCTAQIDFAGNEEFKEKLESHFRYVVAHNRLLAAYSRWGAFNKIPETHAGKQLPPPKRIPVLKYGVNENAKN